MSEFLVIGAGTASLRIANVLAEHIGIEKHLIKIFSRRNLGYTIDGFTAVFDISRLSSFAAVFIATEATNHSAWIQRCINEKVHCYVEKPVITSREFVENPALVDVLTEAEVCVFNGCQYLSHPKIQTLKNFVSNAKLARTELVLRAHIGHDIESWGCWRHNSTVDSISFLKTRDGLFDELIHVYEVLAHVLGVECDIFETGINQFPGIQNPSAGIITYVSANILGTVLIELVSANPIFEIYVATRYDSCFIDFRNETNVSRESVFADRVRTFIDVIRSGDISTYRENNSAVLAGVELRAKGVKNLV